MITLLEKDAKRISCASVNHHDFLNYGQAKFFNYVINLYADVGLSIDSAVIRANDELEYVFATLN
jgi:hypothetical protein